MRVENEWLVVRSFPEVNCQSWHPLLRFSFCTVLNMKLVCFDSHVFYLRIVLFCLSIKLSPIKSFFTIKFSPIHFSDLPNKICMTLKLLWILDVTKMSCSGCLIGHFWQFPTKDTEIQKGNWWKIFGNFFLKNERHILLKEYIKRDFFGGVILKLQKYDKIKKRWICWDSSWK